MPAVTPVTVPVLLIVATDVVPLVQVPVVDVVDSLMVAPEQTDAGPVITPGSGFTVTVINTPQPVVVYI